MTGGMGRGGRTRVELRLYVAGAGPRSARAVARLKELCERELEGRYTIEVIDLQRRPELARAENIIALPTLVRWAPPPAARLIGDLADSSRVRAVLGLPEGSPT